MRGVGQALAGIAFEDTRVSAAASLRSAASALRDLGSQVQGSLRRSMIDGAAVLDRLAASGSTAPADFDTAGQALDRLGREVQATCNFTLS